MLGRCRKEDNKTQKWKAERESEGKKRKNRRLAGQEMLAEKSRRGGGERKRGDWES